MAGPALSLASLLQATALGAGQKDLSQDADALQSPQAASYLRILATLPLSDLRQQPQQLEAKSSNLHRQLSQLCTTQTDAFISIHDAEQSFSPSLAVLTENVSNLLTTSLPAIRRAASAFASASKPVLLQRQKVRHLIERSDTANLADLLEIPQLVQTCISAGHYSEAIQLTECLTELLRNASSTTDKASGQERVVFSLLLETLEHLGVMRMDLLATFNKPALKVPAARKAVTFLRKLNSLATTLSQLSQLQSDIIPQLQLSDTQMCLSFLKARSQSFEASVQSLGQPSSVGSGTYLRRFVDTWRDETTGTLSTAIALFILDSADVTEHQTVSPSYLVSAFASARMARLRSELDEHLLQTSSAQPQNIADTAELFSSVHMQLSLASAALSRFGFDFGRVLFITPSPSSSLTNFEQSYMNALATFLDSAFGSLNNELDAVDSTQPSSWLLSHSTTLSSIKKLLQQPTSRFAEYDDLLQPNIELVDFSPFAKLLNSLLQWFNALYTFAPTSLADGLYLHLNNLLDKASGNLLQLARITEQESVSTFDIPSQKDLSLFIEAEDLASIADLDGEQGTIEVKGLLKERQLAILAQSLTVWEVSVAKWARSVFRQQILASKFESSAATQSQSLQALQSWTQSITAKANEARAARVDAAKARGEERAKAEAEQARLAEEQRLEQIRREEEERLRREEAEAAAESARLAKAERQRIAAEQELEKRKKQEAEEEAKRKQQEEEDQRRREAAAKAEAAARAQAEEEARERAKAEAEAKKEAEEAARAREAEALIKAVAEAQAKAKAEAEAQTREEAEVEAAKTQATLAQEASASQALEKNTREQAEQPAVEDNKLLTRASVPMMESLSATSTASSTTTTTKKNSLAEKLRKRKEERDKAAAALTISAEPSSTEAVTAEPSETETAASTSAVEVVPAVELTPSKLEATYEADNATDTPAPIQVEEQAITDTVTIDDALESADMETPDPSGTPGELSDADDDTVTTPTAAPSRKQRKKKKKANR